MTEIIRHTARPGIDLWQKWRQIGTTDGGEPIYAEVVALESGSISSGGGGGGLSVVEQGAKDSSFEAWEVDANGDWLTDTQLRASPVPVTGPLTDSQLRATPVPVDGPLTDAELRASAIDVNIVSGGGGGGGAATIADGADVTQGAIADTAVVGDNSGTVNAHLRGLNKTLSAGISVDASGHTVPVSGTFWQATQPISGTVTANIGSVATLALDATLTGGTQKTKLVDTGGTNVASISAGGALKVDASGVAVPVTDNSGSLTVDSPAIPTSAGSKTSANSLGVVLASDQAAIPITDNSGSLTIDSAAIPTSAGQKTMANSLGVTLASDQSALSVTDTRLPTALGQTTMSASLPVTLASNQSALPITDNSSSLTIDSAGIPTALGQTTASASMPVTLASDKQIIAAPNTDAIFNSTTSLTPKWATITASSSGAATQVAAVTSKKIRVLALVLTSNGTVNVKFQSHTAGDKTGLFYLIANTGFSLAPNQFGWFETASGEALDINLSANIAVGGVLQYVEV